MKQIIRQEGGEGRCWGFIPSSLLPPVVIWWTPGGQCAAKLPLLLLLLSCPIRPAVHRHLVAPAYTLTWVQACSSTALAISWTTMIACQCTSREGQVWFPALAVTLWSGVSVDDREVADALLLCT